MCRSDVYINEGSFTACELIHVVMFKINEHPSLDELLTFIFYSGLLITRTLANLIEPCANLNQKSISP